MLSPQMDEFCWIVSISKEHFVQNHIQVNNVQISGTIAIFPGGHVVSWTPGCEKTDIISFCIRPKQ